MRRILFGMSLLLVIVSAITVVAGCGGLSSLSELERLLPPGSITSGGSSPFVGQFELTSISVNGTTDNCPAAFTSNGTNYSCDQIIRLFVSDGTFDDSAPTSDIGTGTWQVSGTNNSTLTLNKNGVVTVWTALFAADSSYFVLTSGALSQTWTKH